MRQVFDCSSDVIKRLASTVGYVTEYSARSIDNVSDGLHDVLHNWTMVYLVVELLVAELQLGADVTEECLRNAASHSKNAVEIASAFNSEIIWFCRRFGAGHLSRQG